MTRLVPLLCLTACWLSSAELQSKVASGYADADNDADTDADADADADADTDADTDTDSDADTDADTDTGIYTGTDTPFTCADVSLGTAFGPDVSNGSSEDAVDDFTGPCGDAPDGPDVAHAWTAPGAGCWRFDLLDALYDTKLYVLEDCSGGVITCNDDLIPVTTPQSQVGVRLEAAEDVLVVVDGSAPDESGFYRLNINIGPDMPVDIDLGSSVGEGLFDGDTTPADDTLNPFACSYASAADDLLAWRAPSTGDWSFSLDPYGTDFDSVLSVHRLCAEDALECSDVIGSGGEKVIAWVAEGEEVVVRIAGYTDPVVGTNRGFYRLSIVPYTD